MEEILKEELQKQFPGMTTAMFENKFSDNGVCIAALRAMTEYAALVVKEKEERIKELEATRNPLSLDRVISFLERTKDEKWCTKVVRTEDGKGCVMSHIFDMGGNYFWEMFECMYATTYMIYPVNDGESPKYQQSTPKERVIAYLKDMRDKKVKSTLDIENEYDESRIKLPSPPKQ